MKPARYAIAVALAIGGVAGVAFAQSGGGYTIRRHTEDGGGARMSGAGYVLQGTVGQPDATGTALAGAQGYALRGGFWVAATTIERPDPLFTDGFE